VFGGFAILWRSWLRGFESHLAIFGVFFGLRLFHSLVAQPNVGEVAALPLQALSFSLLIHSLASRFRHSHSFLQGRLSAWLFRTRANSVGVVLVYPGAWICAGREHRRPAHIAAAVLRFPVVRQFLNPGERLLFWGGFGATIVYHTGHPPGSRFFTSIPLMHHRSLYLALAPQALGDIRIKNPQVIAENAAGAFPPIPGPLWPRPGPLPRAGTRQSSCESRMRFVPPTRSCGAMIACRSESINGDNAALFHPRGRRGTLSCARGRRRLA
jgi:hypothetical protein